MATQAPQQDTNLASLGIRTSSLSVEPFEGGVIAWLSVEPAAQGLIDAAETEAFRIEEVGQVPKARVRNDSDRPVVLRADTVVSGGKQTRVVERTSIVPPFSSVLVSVRCVEARRWSAESPDTTVRFTMVGTTSRSMRVKLSRQRDSTLRTTGHHELNQREVWREVTVELQTSKVTSRTDSYLPLVTDVRSRDRARARAMGIAPPPSANAALVMLDHGVAWAEVFASSSALGKHAEELVADLVEAARSSEGEPAGPPSVSAALARLHEATVCRVQSDTEALSQPFALQSSRVCGSLLMHQARVAHLSAVIG
jgi:hypothetical protein